MARWQRTPWRLAALTPRKAAWRPSGYRTSHVPSESWAEDSNGSFRPWLLDYTTMALGHRHPDLMDYFPGLATKWAVDREAKTIYVELDPLATWSDGVPITADDYLFMFWMHRSSYITAPWYNNWYSTQYTNITKYDDHLISISTVSEPDKSIQGVGTAAPTQTLLSRSWP